LVRWFLLSFTVLAVSMSGAADAVAIPIVANFTQAFRPPNTPASLPALLQGGAASVTLQFHVPDFAQIVSIHSIEVSVDVLDDMGGIGAESGVVRLSTTGTGPNLDIASFNMELAGGALTFSGAVAPGDVAAAQEEIADNGFFRIRVRRDTGDFFVTAGRITIDAELAPAFTDFRGVRRLNGINIGPDVGGTNHQALNFTGNAVAAGDTWITVYDPAPNPPSVTVGSVSLSADVLIHAYNNKKGAGLLALYNEAPGSKGLALTLYDAGNTDTLVLATVDQAGKLATLKTVRLGAGIAENVWYRVNMDVTVDAGLVTVVGAVAAHAVPTDPNSALAVQVGPTLTFSATLGVGALVGVEATGEVGILAAAVNAANSSSVTNVLIDPQDGGTSCLSASRC
jgi:hypothetical protein